MQAAFEFFANLGPWNWFIAGVVLLALEIMIPGVYLLWFGLAAIVTGFVALATGAVWEAQVVVFAASAILLLFVVRRYLGAGPAVTDTPDLNVRGQHYIGRVFTVEEAIAGGRGKIRVGDTVWIAKGPDLPKGARVEVKSVDGATLVVVAAR